MPSEWVANSDGVVRRRLAKQVPLKTRSEGRAGTCGRRSLSGPRIAGFHGEVSRGGITSPRTEGAGAVDLFCRDARQYPTVPCGWWGGDGRQGGDPGGPRAPGSPVPRPAAAGAASRCGRLTKHGAGSSSPGRGRSRMWAEGPPVPSLKSTPAVPGVTPVGPAARLRGARPEKPKLP
ncbi:collagen alpha-1(I) chain [Cebus imitator]|uniref:collagen alpha-1(I) chain n=1 Tax=Cebus imitator TaxID=2715852 RepID=UPI000809C0BE|nr:collagen alpha-1(I) chain [Cebus imitator]